MAFISYLSYMEYKQLGGKVPEESFNVLERKAQRLVDYITFDRIPELSEIPDEVKEVITEFVTRMDAFNNQVEAGDTISAYSNGVERLEYKLKTEDEHTDELIKVAKKILPDYLLARSVRFDVKKYIQSADNNP